MAKNNISELFGKSSYHMADVGGKLATFRRALAMGRITVGKSAFIRIKNASLPKGDALVMAEIAGITGAKKASDLMPMCHPLSLDHVAIHTEIEEETSSIAVYCIASTVSKTGVEMEALAGVNAALLTIYDLTKPVEPALTISDIRLLLKEGGKKGLWVHPDGIPEHLDGLLPDDSKTLLSGISAAVITMSDRASKGIYEDKSGVALKELLSAEGASVDSYEILPDDKSTLINHLEKLQNQGNINLIITTGGTGLAKTDITPEAILEICDYTIAGFGEMLRHSGSRHISSAWLSRSLAAVFGDILIIALPGSQNAVREGMEALRGLLPHALDTIAGKGDLHHKHNPSPNPLPEGEGFRGKKAP